MEVEESSSSRPQCGSQPSSGGSQTLCISPLALLRSSMTNQSWTEVPAKPQQSRRKRHNLNFLSERTGCVSAYRFREMVLREFLLRAKVVGTRGGANRKFTSTAVHIKAIAERDLTTANKLQLSTGVLHLGSGPSTCFHSGLALWAPGLQYINSGSTLGSLHVWESMSKPNTQFLASADCVSRPFRSILSLARQMARVPCGA